MQASRKEAERRHSRETVECGGEDYVVLRVGGEFALEWSSRSVGLGRLIVLVRRLAQGADADLEDVERELP